MKIDIRDTDLPMLRQLLLGAAQAAEDDKLRAMLVRVIREIEHRMNQDGVNTEAK